MERPAGGSASGAGSGGGCAQTSGSKGGVAWWGVRWRVGWGGVGWGMGWLGLGVVDEASWDESLTSVPKGSQPKAKKLYAVGDCSKSNQLELSEALLSSMRFNNRWM